MRISEALKKIDYKVLAVVCFLLAVILGLLSEALCFRTAKESGPAVFSEYGRLMKSVPVSKKDLFLYLLRQEGKRTLILFLLSFTVLGLPCNLGLFSLISFRYCFFLSAVFRNAKGTSGLFCITAVLLCLLCCAPVFMYCIRLSHRSFIYCMENRKRLLHCTKYRLQTELKMGIIIVLYGLLSAVVETTIAAGLFAKMFS